MICDGMCGVVSKDWWLHECESGRVVSKLM